MAEISHDFQSICFPGKMATVDPDEAEITCKNPECPKGVFKWKTILNHVVRAKKCKIFYSSADIEQLRSHSKELQNKKEAKRKRDNYNSVQSSPGTTTVEQARPEKIKTQCKVCKEFFISLLSHLNKSNCKSSNSEQYDNLKFNINGKCGCRFSQGYHPSRRP